MQFMNRSKRWFLILAIIVIAICLGIYARHAGSSGVLRRYKAQLRAKGEKLTFAELAVPVSTNAEEIISRSIWATNSFSFSAPVCKLMEFVNPGVARIAWQGELHLDSATGQGNANPSNTNNSIGGNWAAFEKQNEAIAPSLNLFRKALVHPAPDTGRVYRDDLQSLTNRPPRTFVRDRTISYALVDALTDELHQGDFDAAVADLHALIGMARMNRNELTLVHQVFHGVFADLGVKASWEAMQSTNWDEPGLAALQHDWEQVNLLDGIERGFLAERASGQVVMSRVRHASGRHLWEIIPYDSGPKKIGTNSFFGRLCRDHFIPLLYKLTSADRDELLDLTFVSNLADAARSLKSNQPWPQVGIVVGNLYKELDATVAEDRFGRYMFSEVAIPNYSRALERTAESETGRRLAIAAIALRRYELQHGRPPANLAALTPEFLESVPMDPMSGKALCYRLNPDSSFVLYSVGKDGHDDGGKGGMDLWSGPDAVWPTAAALEPGTTRKAQLPNK